MSKSKYLDDTDIGAGYQDDEGRGRQVQGRDDPDEMYEGGGAGLDGVVHGVGAGLDGTVQGVGAGLDGMVQGVGTGRGGMEQGEGAGLDDGVQDGVQLPDPA